MNDADLALGDALAEIFSAIEAHSESRPKRAGTMRLWKMSELADFDEKGGRWMDDPVGLALRHGVKGIGETMAETRSTDTMREIAEYAARRGGHYGTRINLADKWWNGIKDVNGDTWIA